VGRLPSGTRDPVTHTARQLSEPDTSADVPPRVEILAWPATAHPDTGHRHGIRQTQRGDMARSDQARRRRRARRRGRHGHLEIPPVFAAHRTAPQRSGACASPSTGFAATPPTTSPSAPSRRDGPGCVESPRCSTGSSPSASTRIAGHGRLARRPGRLRRVRQGQRDAAEATRQVAWGLGEVSPASLMGPL